MNEQIGRFTLRIVGHKRVIRVETDKIGEGAGIQRRNQRRRQQMVQRRLPRFPQPDVLPLRRLHRHPPRRGHLVDEEEVPHLIRRFKQGDDNAVEQTKQAEYGRDDE